MVGASAESVKQVQGAASKRGKKKKSNQKEEAAFEKSAAESRVTLFFPRSLLPIFISQTMDARGVYFRCLLATLLFQFLESVSRSENRGLCWGNKLKKALV
jgi:hypothetical protein